MPLVTGFRYVFQGAKLLSHPGLRLFVLLPLLVNVLMFAIGLAVLIFFVSGWMDGIVSWLPSWLSGITWVLWVLFILLFGVAVFFGFNLLANFIAAPFNIKGLPTFYKARHLIAQFMEQQIPGIEVCKRNGSIVFNKAKMTHLKDLDETAYVPDHEDEDELMEAAGCQVYVTKESFFRTLTNIYVKKIMQWPDFITFKNNNNTAPYICPFTFQQLDNYSLDNGKQVLILCGACKRTNCNYKDYKCPLNVVKANHEVAKYAAEKKRKQETHKDNITKAKKAKAWFASKSKNRFAWRTKYTRSLVYLKIYQEKALENLTLQNIYGTRIIYIYIYIFASSVSVSEADTVTESECASLLAMSYYYDFPP